LENKNLVAIMSGANMDFDRLRFVSERADSREILVAVKLSETPGSFLKMYTLLYPPRNVTGFSYRCNGTDTADILMSYQASSGRTIDEDRIEVKRLLEENGHEVTDLQDNEMAKAHARYLTGGRGKFYDVNNDSSSSGGSVVMKEMLYRFEFPESPGALSRFLHLLQENNPGWSISLFHYRNYGDDFGRVLVGFRVPQTASVDGSFDNFLENVKYKCYNECSNSVYEQFLR